MSTLCFDFSVSRTSGDVRQSVHYHRTSVSTVNASLSLRYHTVFWQLVGSCCVYYIVQPPDTGCSDCSTSEHIPQETRKKKKESSTSSHLALIVYSVSQCQIPLTSPLWPLLESNFRLPISKVSVTSDCVGLDFKSCAVHSGGRLYSSQACVLIPTGIRRRWLTRLRVKRHSNGVCFQRFKFKRMCFFFFSWYD